MLVEIIKPGILVRNDLGMILKASSTVTLVRGDGHDIVVDTGLPFEAQQILKGLSERGLSPEDIDIVINTHLHGDHTGGNALFTRAKFYTHVNERPAKLDNVVAVEGDHSLSGHIDLLETPGHTRGSISVIVRDPERHTTHVVSGDALPTKDNYLKWVPPGINYDPGIALASMRRIVELADFVVPGHDDIFSIDK